jgi:hypothetical protein
MISTPVSGTTPNIFSSEKNATAAVATVLVITPDRPKPADDDCGKVLHADDIGGGGASNNKVPQKGAGRNKGKIIAGCGLNVVEMRILQHPSFPQRQEPMTKPVLLL